MGIAVKRGDFLFLFLNGISAITVRANVSLRPKTWWGRVKQMLSDPTDQDPFNVYVDAVSSTDRSQVIASVEIRADGEIDSASCIVIAGTVPTGPGEVYASASISRAGAPGQFWAVMGGYIRTNGPGVSYPGLVMGPLDGPGRRVTLSLGDPAANAEYVANGPPTGVKWRRVSFHGQLVQGITQTPQPTIQIKDGFGNIIGGGAAGSIQSASTTIDYYAGMGLGFSGTNETPIATTPGAETFGITDMQIGPTDSINWVTNGLGANSNWGPGFLGAEEWISP